MLQLPDASAKAVPSKVTPSVSNRLTLAPDSAPVPLKVGVATLVTLSLFDVPLSDAACRSGALGASAVASTVTTSAAEAALVFPATSVCLAVRVCPPSASAELVIVQLPAPLAIAEPSTVVPSVSSSVTVAPDSAPDPVKTGVVV